jgi:hypothetical protein
VRALSLHQRELELIEAAIRDIPESVTSGRCSPDCARQYLAMHFATRLRAIHPQLDVGRFIAECRGAG